MDKINEAPQVRVLDCLISALSFSRQSRDLDEAEFSLRMERELLQRRDTEIASLRVGEEVAA